MPDREPNHTTAPSEPLPNLSRGGSALMDGSKRDQPRERLLRLGTESLLEVELLALCLGSGTAGDPALAIAARLLKEFGSIDALVGARPERLVAQRGLGLAKVARLKAVAALAERVARREAEEELADAPVFSSTQAVRRFLRLQLGSCEREVFAVMLLDTRHRMLAFERLFHGTIDSASVHPREIIKRCLEVNAAAVVLSHNHPSGVAEPSVADIAITERLMPLLREVGVRLLDHVVVSRGQEVSMAARGLI